MKTKHILLTFLLITISILGVNAQTATGKTDIKSGIGLGILGKGDMLISKVEQELTHKFTSYISSSVALNIGFGSWGVDNAASLISTDLNAFVSPFKNTRVFNFKLGTGASYMYAYNIDVDDVEYDNNGMRINNNSWIDKRKTIGFNVIIEPEVSINQRLLLATRLYTQLYTNDVFTGISLRIGYKL